MRPRMYVYVCAIVHTWKSENHLKRLVLSIPLVVSGFNTGSSSVEGVPLPLEPTFWPLQFPKEFHLCMWAQ